jgi:putative effector of murein hydrolase
MFALIDIIITTILIIVIIVNINMTHYPYKHYMQPKQGSLSLLLRNVSCFAY